MDEGFTKTETAVLAALGALMAAMAAVSLFM